MDRIERTILEAEEAMRRGDITRRERNEIIDTMIGEAIERQRADMRTPEDTPEEVESEG